MIYDMGVSLPSGKLVWSVPKFDVNSDLELTDTLKMLGVTDAFDDTRADFSPLADFDEPAAVTQVQHAARVKIDEEGCEAAAFTAIMGNATSAMPEDLPVVEMNLNRPFAFAITGADGLPGRSCYCDALQRFFRERAGRLQQAAAILARWR